MELSERKLNILAEIISLYNKTGEAVSSKMLSDIFGSYSSATIRNDMANLEALGFLNQPHTSSGRVPTYLGYRMYVDNILHTNDLKRTEKHAIDTLLTVNDLNPEYFLQIVSDVLATKTNYAAIATLPTNDYVTIKGLEFIMINNKTIVATVVFSTAHIKNKVCRLDVAISSSELDSFCKMVNSKIGKKHLGDLTPEFLENLILMLGTYNLFLMPLINAIKDMCGDLNNKNVILGGKNNLFKFNDFNSKIDDVFNILSNSNTIYRLLNTDDDHTKIIIGEETGIDSISGSSIITTKYTFGDNYKGTIGVIGPMRMDYENVIPHIEYIKNVVEDRFSNIVEEDDY